MPPFPSAFVTRQIPSCAPLHASLLHPPGTHVALRLGWAAAAGRVQAQCGLEVEVQGIQEFSKCSTLRVIGPHALDSMHAAGCATHSFTASRINLRPLTALPTFGGFRLRSPRMMPQGLERRLYGGSCGRGFAWPAEQPSEAMASSASARLASAMVFRSSSTPAGMGRAALRTLCRVVVRGYQQSGRARIRRQIVHNAF